MTSPIAKRWVFTLQADQVCEHSQLPPGVEYLLVGPLEVCPTTGAQHRHGVLIFEKKQKATAVRKLLPNVHHEVMRGTPLQAKRYALKEGAAELELGVLVGEKTKIGDEIALLLPTNTLQDIYQKYPGYMMMNWPKVEAMKARIAKWGATHEPKVVVWIYGATGVGKTRFASELFPDAPICDYIEPFMHGYNLEKTVILDELRHDVPLRSLLRLTDRYKFSVNVKNGSTPWLATRIIITAPEHPETMFCLDRGFAADHVGQLTRRLTAIVRLSDSDVYIDHGGSRTLYPRDAGILRLRSFFDI